MEGPRPPIDKELGELFQFLNDELRPQNEWSIVSEYPTVFDNRNSGNIRIITEGDKVLSHAVMKPMIIKSPAGLFKAAGIGSVVTSSQHRGKGLSTKNLNSCLEAAENHGCDFAILWTDLFDFYRKLGFELVGSEISFELTKPIADLPPGTTVKETNKVSADALLRVYSQHTVQTLRTREDIQKGLEIPNSRVYTLWSGNNELLAYAVEGKGADLNGYIHEWGGKVSHLLPLFSEIQRQQGRNIQLIVPSHSSNLIAELEKHGLFRVDGYLGMIKILNPKFLASKIKRYARALGYHDLVFEFESGKFYFGTEAEIFATDSSADICRLIFGPQKAKEIHTFDKETEEVFEKLFPLPMWIWGWDSI